LPYHLVNVAMHVMCGILLWQVLRRLQIKAAWFGAALWALHPVQVESVAWITELKNTQSCFFYLLSIVFFLRWREDRDRLQDKPFTLWHYSTALVCAAAAILSKSSTVTLPAVLWLCCWWQDGRWQWRHLRTLVPFGLVAVLAAAWTIWEQRFHARAVGDEWAQTGVERFIIAGQDIWFYLGKLLWPNPLIFIYPRWKVENVTLISFFPAAAAFATLFLLWWKRSGLLRGAFFAITYFIFSLFPVLGFFNVYFFRYSFVADHFQYLASIGPIALFAATLSKLASKRRASWHLEVASAALLFLLLGGLTWRQTKIYHNAETLWTDTLAKNPDSWSAHNNLGVELLRKGQLDDAMIHFQKTLAIKSDYAEAENNLGNVFFGKGQMDDAVAHYQKALEIKPDYASAHNNLGNVFLRRGELNQSIAHYLKAIEIKPDLAEAHNNLGLAYREEGKLEEAIRHYQRALVLRPDDAEAHYNLAEALLQLGRRDEATAHLTEALRIKPDYSEAKRELEMLGVAKSE